MIMLRGWIKVKNGEVPEGSRIVQEKKFLQSFQ